MIHDLRVYHELKRTGAVAESGPGVSPHVFSLDTCQRRIWLFKEAGLPVGHTTPQPWGPSVEIFEGRHAYAFLLRVVSGLESQMRGETEVAGQFKDAWSQYCLGTSRQALALQPLVQKLFEDVKTVRSKHLRNMGQASYGSLVRRLLTRTRLRRPIVIVGAGQFAKSLLPWLTSFDVRVANRSAARAVELAAEMNGCCDAPGPFHENPIRIVSFEEAFASQGHLILCVPGGDERLSQLVTAHATLATDGTLIFDLGEPAVLGNQVASSVSRITLEDLYALQKEEEQVRSVEVEQARRACQDLAIAREARSSMTFTNGWEDLWSHGA